MNSAAAGIDRFATPVVSRVENQRLNFGDYPSNALIHRHAEAPQADEGELLGIELLFQTVGYAYL